MLPKTDQSTKRYKIWCFDYFCRFKLSQRFKKLEINVPDKTRNTGFNFHKKTFTQNSNGLFWLKHLGAWSRFSRSRFPDWKPAGEKDFRPSSMKRAYWLVRGLAQFEPHSLHPTLKGTLSLEPSANVIKHFCFVTAGGQNSIFTGRFFAELD